MYRTHYHQAISEIVSNIVMDRRDSVTANELGSSAFGISVNNMIGRFNELDRLQELARSAEEDRELALRLGAENKDLKDQVETLKKAEGAEYHSQQRNYKMENLALRALQQRSNKTIAMLQARLKEKGDDYSDISSNIPDVVAAPIVVGEQWKLSGRKPDTTVPLYSQQTPGHQQYPPSSPTPHQQELSKTRPTHYLPPLAPEHGDTESSKYFLAVLNRLAYLFYF
jgi:hypothetical protein